MLIRLCPGSEQPLVPLQVYEVDWRYLVIQTSLLSIYISLTSRTAWEGLEKPVSTFSSDHILKCGGVCTSTPGDCDTFHYDFWHQQCSTAKVGYHQGDFILTSHTRINRLATVLPLLIRSATRQSLRETILALDRERLGSGSSMRLNIVSRTKL